MDGIEERQVEITEDDLVAAVLAAYEPDDDSIGMTTRELIAKTGRCNKSVLQQLRRLKDAGRLEVAQRRDESIDGRVIRVPVYVLKNKIE